MRYRLFACFAPSQSECVFVVQDLSACLLCRLSVRVCCAGSQCAFVVQDLSACLFCRISVRVGNHFNDLTEVEQIEMSEPSGWVTVPLRDLDERPVRTYMVQVAVLANHQNGRDTHMRQIKVHSPVSQAKTAYHFTTVDVKQFQTVR